MKVALGVRTGGLFATSEAIEREVTARPLIALLIAALVGYVLAQLTSS